MLNYCVVSVAFTRGCCCVCALLTWLPCAVNLASARGRFGLRGWLLQPQLGRFRVYTRLLRPSLAVALTSASSCLSVCTRLLRCLRAVWFGVCVRLLLRAVALAILVSMFNCLGYNRLKKYNSELLNVTWLVYWMMSYRNIRYFSFDLVYNLCI